MVLTEVASTTVKCLVESQIKQHVWQQSRSNSTTSRREQLQLGQQKKSWRKIVDNDSAGVLQPYAGRAKQLRWKSLSEVNNSIHPLPHHSRQTLVTSHPTEPPKTSQLNHHISMMKKRSKGGGGVGGLCIGRALKAGLRIHLFPLFCVLSVQRHNHAHPHPHSRHRNRQQRHFASDSGVEKLNNGHHIDGRSHSEGKKAKTNLLNW